MKNYSSSANTANDTKNNSAQKSTAASSTFIENLKQQSCHTSMVLMELTNKKDLCRAVLDTSASNSAGQENIQSSKKTRKLADFILPLKKRPLNEAKSEK